MILRENTYPKLSLFYELVFFISAYFPLFLILYIRDMKFVTSEPITIKVGQIPCIFTVSYLAAIMLILSACCTIWIGWICKKYLLQLPDDVQPNEYKKVIIKSSNRQHGDMINFTLPFLIGLFAFDYKSIQSIASLFVFLTFMFFFLRNENMLLLNPMLLLKKVTLHDIKYIEIGDIPTQSARVLCIGTPKPSNNELYLKEIAGTHFLCPKSEK
ncbi:hypothetical protein CWN93_08350 [Vibrio splendidus]|nr:hypothetical protein A150_05935 [Vibrio splendidus 1S-124]PTO83228.1 hypothetical protein CWN93_08350 [Vibrio splendidus]PTQ19423.1 hypothetical protein CWO14_11090 [Vibrio splendidus]